MPERRSRGRRAVSVLDEMAAADPAFKALLEEERAKAVENRASLKNGHDYSVALEPINPATLFDVPVPPRQWLVPDWVPMARVTALYGAGGEGKTLLAQMLATACAMGKPWLGLPVRQCRSLLLFAEDDRDEMHARQEAINGHYGCTFADLSAMRWLPRLGEDCELMAFEGPRAIRTPLFDQLLSLANEHGAQLIVTDTLSDVFAGNENDRAQVRRFGRLALGHLAHVTGAAVVAPAHPSLTGISKGTGDSASTGWRGTFRSQLYLASKQAGEDAPTDPDVRTLSRTKSNWSRRDETIDLRWENGVFISLHAPTGILGSIERRTRERVFIDLLENVIAEGQHVSHNSRAGNYAPKIFAQRPERERFTKTDFAMAMQSLLACHAIVIATYKGSDRKPYDHIIPGAGGYGRLVVSH